MVNHHNNATAPCLIKTWHLSESKIYYWLLRHSGDQDLSFDLLQDTFLKALQQQHAFCHIKNQQAWLFRVANNLLIDTLRKSDKQPVLAFSEWKQDTPHEEHAPVDSLAQCLPKALSQLCPEDREIIEQCDLSGVTQQQFAKDHQLTLAATKSRIQRARKKIKTILKTQCHIRFDEQQRVCCFYPEKVS
ncbi:MAG: hypothetical protein CENE_00981 [Candidatus Celerinatantimonas neptuna]|nr:MAG: hypothetical protein CENE_00981 [Candidatus Celerinatantimonas neptuna]